MRAEVQYSIVQNKFQEWFENPAPVDIPLPEEVDDSIENFASGDSRFIAGANRLNRGRNKTHRIRKRHTVDSTKILELLFFGFLGAVFLGAIFGIIIDIMNSNFEGWYSDTWPSQSAVILIAIVLGFNIGLVNGYYFSLQRER